MGFQKYQFENSDWRDKGLYTGRCMQYGIHLRKQCEDIYGGHKSSKFCEIDDHIGARTR
jgi:hypothetical protein